MIRITRERCTLPGEGAKVSPGSHWEIRSDNVFRTFIIRLCPGLNISLDVLPMWADSRSCSPSTPFYDFFNRRHKCHDIECFWSQRSVLRKCHDIECFESSGWCFSTFSKFSEFSMFSMFCQLTQCSPIQDGRMELFVEPCLCLIQPSSTNLFDAKGGHGIKKTPHFQMR